MTSLAEKERLKGKVQTIYFDPPYGIKFGSNWQVSTRKKDVKDGKGEDATRQPEQIKAFRDTWQLGIHSYLAYIRDRLVISNELLTESGSIFVQISEENVHLVRNILDEVFGSENFVSLITFRKKFMSLGSDLLDSMSDYILFYAKNRKEVKYRTLYSNMNVEGDSHWNYIETEENKRIKLSRDEINNHKLIQKNCKIFQLSNLYPAGINQSGLFNVEFRGKNYFPPVGNSWKTNPEGMRRCILANRIEPYETGDTLRYILYLDDYPVTPIDNLWDKVASPSDKIYVVQTTREVIQRCILMTSDPGDIILDPTCGSGTTAYLSEQWGRRWITIDTSRVALALARTRLMSSRFPYYILSDSNEGIKKEQEISGRIISTNNAMHDVKKGFVLKRVPHLTMESIGKNEELDAIDNKWDAKLKETLSKLNSSLNQNWKEWEIPREVDEKWSEEIVNLHSEWWQLRWSRQKEINESISKRADTEMLYDQPYEDNKRIRVAGPFTVESLSPHRMLATDEDRPASEKQVKKNAGVGQFENMILGHLKSSGVQNTIKNERLKFDRLEPFAGIYILAHGEYTENGKSKHVAVCIGPEHGTVGPELIKDAAKEAVQGIGYDLLIVCGFAFDPHVSEEAKRYGKLQILITKMNPDLAMGDELLKKTGAGNLFMVFGEPDITIKEVKDGKYKISIKGLDVYDPTTGVIRSHSTDDIACWFIDTNYNGESFFVRHAYFTGADKPYERLKKALRAEINEEAWSSLYSTTSQEFDKPKTGKVAVKVINHYGDEVLKVYEIK
jgi:adenine-specific DNA-methyltransferase